MAGLVVALAAVALNTQAQPPAGGRGGGGGGGGGSAVAGGREAPAASAASEPGGNLFMLANNEAVQKEIKMTDRQKAAVKKLSDDQNTKRRDAMQQLRQQPDVAKNQAAQQAQAAGPDAAAARSIPRSTHAGAGAGNAAGRCLEQPRLSAAGLWWSGLSAVRARSIPPCSSKRPRSRDRWPANNVQQQGWHDDASGHATAPAGGRAMNWPGCSTRTSSSGSGKSSSRPKGRRPCSAKTWRRSWKSTRTSRPRSRRSSTRANQARRQMMTKNFQFMRSLMPAPPGGNAPGAAGGQANGFAGGQEKWLRWPGRTGWPGSTRRTTGQDNQAHKEDQAGRLPGRTSLVRAGQGDRVDARGQNRPRVDPEAMQKIMEKPEVKAKMEEFQNEQAQLRQQEYAMVYKAMDRRQVSSSRRCWASRSTWTR